jgi:hypothetical protein
MLSLRTLTLPLVALYTLPALAEPKSDALFAQGLFDAGLALMDAGRYAEACPKFEESQRLAPGGGTLLNLALCHDKEGKYATAAVEYDQALAQATTEKRADRMGFARERLTEVQTKVPKLVVVIAGSRTDIDVQLDSRPLSKAMLGIEIPIDPGTHKLTATSAGQSWEQPVELKAGERREVQIKQPVPAASVLAEPARLGAPPVVAGYPVANPLRTPLLLTGVALVSVSAITGVLAYLPWTTYRNDCLPDRAFCRTQEGSDAAIAARNWSIVSTVALGLGVTSWIVALALPSKRVEVGMIRF